MSTPAKLFKTQPEDLVKRNKRRSRNIDIDKLEKQAKTVLAREIERLMDLSHDKAMEREDTIALQGYFKIIKDLKKDEADQLDSMSDDELERLSKGAKDED